MTSVNGQAYTWDNNGNLTNDGSQTYLYSQANQLITITATGLTWSAAYNGDGARLKQIANGVPTTYTLDPSTPLRAGLAAPLVTVLTQQDAPSAGGKKQYLYGMGDSPLAGYDGTAWTYLSGRDGLNSVRQETDAAGNVLTTRSFDPYGVPLQGGEGTPFGYTGEMADSTGLVFLRARYMQPGLGVFLSRDWWQGDTMQPSNGEWYLYADGNPINYTDPSGMCASWPECIQEAGKWASRLIQRSDSAAGELEQGANEIASEMSNISDAALTRSIAALRAGGAAVKGYVICELMERSNELQQLALSDPIDGYIIGGGRVVTSGPVGVKSYGTNADVTGYETVYDLRHRQRGVFSYHGAGFNVFSLAGVSYSFYEGMGAGFAWDLTDYSGPFLSVSTGASLGKGLSAGGGLAVAVTHDETSIQLDKFKSLTTWVGGEGGLSAPITLLVADTQYSPPLYRQSYDSSAPGKSYLYSRLAGALDMISDDILPGSSPWFGTLAAEHAIIHVFDKENSGF